VTVVAFAATAYDMIDFKQGGNGAQLQQFHYLNIASSPVRASRRARAVDRTIHDRQAIRVNVPGRGSSGLSTLADSSDLFPMFAPVDWEDPWEQAFGLVATVADNRAEVSWTELEVPVPNNRADLSWTELEVPTPDNRSEVSWAELEVPTLDNRADISWVEFEIATDNRAEMSWTELEVPTPNNRSDVSWAELEVPTPDNRAELSWAELEVPSLNNRAEISWAEFEVPTFGDLGAAIIMFWMRRLYRHMGA
jgi:hypothetical protein